jgi:uncharacterized OB-fold protein
MSGAVQPVLEGWFTTGDAPHLIGTQCSACGTYYFPKLESVCRNPDCDSSQFETVELSRTGTLWSFTNACYKPPEPYIAAEPFEPYAIAAVELAKEKMIVLGQVVTGVGVDRLHAGLAMELVVETIADAEDPAGKLVWKWKPLEDRA